MHKRLKLLIINCLFFNELNISLLFFKSGDLKIKKIPRITKIDKINSCFLILTLLNNGSIIAVNRAVVERQVTANETLYIFIASKTNPMNSNYKTC